MRKKVGVTGSQTDRKEWDDEMLSFRNTDYQGREEGLMDEQYRYRETKRRKELQVGE